MKQLKPPFEMFYWNLHDENGNVKIEIRDSQRKTAFFMSIKGREFFESEWMIKEMCPLVVKLLNAHYQYYGHTEKPLEAIKEEPIEKKVKNPWGRAGRPINV